MSLTTVARERADKLVSNIEYHAETIRLALEDSKKDLLGYVERGETGSAEAKATSYVALVLVAENLVIKALLDGALELRDGLPSSS